MNKKCTSLEQSKKLMELGIDVNTADMCHRYRWSNNSFISLPCAEKAKEPITGDIPAWSLPALLAQMPCVELISSQDNKYRVFWKDRFSEWHDNAVDACVELIERVRKEEEQ